jgi:hypothetical protein
VTDGVASEGEIDAHWHEMPRPNMGGCEAEGFLVSCSGLGVRE